MVNITYICDGCKATSKDKMKKFYSEKYKTDIDLCEPCQNLLIEHVLRTASILVFCEKCKGIGTVDGERVDTSCSANRPEYQKIKCDQCNYWRENRSI